MNMKETSPTEPQSRYVHANGLAFCVETRGDPSGEPVLFIMGLAAQLTLWPENLLNIYAEAGYRVICFDNRDIGLSSHIDERLTGHPIMVMARHRLGMSIDAPYTLHDMAEDTACLIEALDLDSVHVVGVSMGGMIAQLLAAIFPARVRSLTLIMTSTNSPKLPLPKPGVILKLAGMSAKGLDEETVVERGLMFWNVIGSPDYPPREEELRARLLRDYRRSFDPAGIRRQMRAIMATGSLTSTTRRINADTVIIHGSDDPLIRPVAADELKDLLPHARLEKIRGMGHDLPEALLADIAAISLAVISGGRVAPERELSGVPSGAE
ncbi:MAG: alpha/beta hydrolase [Oleiphilaceae bacterium]|nr:alpha/beta hydrolase [Oleiphilaceae bacterium]